MEIVAKAAAVAVLCAACSLLIKAKNPEYSFVLSAICAVCVCAAAVGMISQLADFVSGIIKSSGLPSAIFVPIIKCVGIAVLTKLVCNLCKDAGQNGTSSAVEYLGSAAMVYAAMPLLGTLLKTLEGLT